MHLYSNCSLPVRIHFYVLPNLPSNFFHSLQKKNGYIWALFLCSSTGKIYKKLSRFTNVYAQFLNMAVILVRMHGFKSQLCHFLTVSLVKLLLSCNSFICIKGNNNSKYLVRLLWSSRDNACKVLTTVSHGKQSITLITIAIVN